MPAGFFLSWVLQAPLCLSRLFCGIVLPCRMLSYFIEPPFLNNGRVPGQVVATRGASVPVVTAGSMPCIGCFVATSRQESSRLMKGWTGYDMDNSMLAILWGLGDFPSRGNARSCKWLGWLNGPACRYNSHVREKCLPTLTLHGHFTVPGYSPPSCN